MVCDIRCTNSIGSKNQVKNLLDMDVPKKLS
jgi:hypothetical protein